ncbi:hypothetical protein PAXRUDRAFT_173184, partial [Paxillus rubicundulus Ve08.2h10]
DKTECSQILHQPMEPPMHAPQIQLLDHFATYQPELLWKKLHIDPKIFKCL